MALGYTEYEEGYRHGRRDFAVGLYEAEASLAGVNEEYWQGYRKGYSEQQQTYRELTMALPR